jgi:hypothetical protein
VDPVPDPLLLRKSSTAWNRTRDLWVSSHKLLPPDRRGGPMKELHLTNIQNEKVTGSNVLQAVDTELDS